MPRRVFIPESFELRDGVREQIHTHREPERQIVADSVPRTPVGTGDDQANVNVAAWGSNTVHT